MPQHGNSNCGLRIVTDMYGRTTHRMLGATRATMPPGFTLETLAEYGTATERADLLKWWRALPVFDSHILPVATLRADRRSAIRMRDREILAQDDGLKASQRVAYQVHNMIDVFKFDQNEDAIY